MVKSTIFSWWAMKCSPVQLQVQGYVALNAAGDLIVREVYIWTLVKLDTGRAKSGEKTGPVLHNRQEDHESFLRHLYPPSFSW